MRAVVQRVTNADVKIDGRVNGKIDDGLLVLLGVGNGDTEEDMKYIADKIIKLRIFSDENDKMNLSLEDVGGSMLVISQFTLYGDCSHGRRPYFGNAMEPVSANEMYEKFVAYIKEQGIHTETGEFGADMKVSLTEREVTDYNKMIEILKSCDCCRIGLVDDKGAYIVPMNFGYEDNNGKLTLYFHGATEGKKIDLINNQPEISFETDTKHELVTSDTACGHSYLYQSIMGRGQVKIVADRDTKIKGLNQIMHHYTGKSDYEFNENVLERTAVIKLAVTEWSCKEH